MMFISGYRILDQLYESPNSCVYRAMRQEDDIPIILKVLRENYPTPAELVRYKQEYEITRSLKLSGVIRSYALERYGHTPVIVFEDFGAQSLADWITGRKLSIEEFLVWGIKIADGLGQVHVAKVIHKDINPANVVLNPQNGRLKIIDFGISTVLSRETPDIKTPEALEGTLAYISPEQTGRINRVLDYRTDLYSLGATFYELLTGQVPFVTSDPMELVHSHLAKTPASPQEHDPVIPQVISELVMKLLAKNAEDRYQSAWGVKADLEKCLKGLRKGHEVAHFSLASKDVPEQFQLSQKLYGREAEIATLLGTYNQVLASSKCFTLVSGYSGIGKTRLVREIYKPVTERRGFFISGKFEQWQRTAPYLAIINALRELMRHLLTQGQIRLGMWEEKILTALGAQGQVMTDIIPELELVIGPQPPAAGLGPAETQNRFVFLFLNFLRVFCSQGNPLVIFLDDLQWADSASLRLIEHIASAEELSGLLLIGAYRDNEVDRSHPLMLTVDCLEREGASLHRIPLAPLSETDVSKLLMDSLRRDIPSIAPLADLVGHKTGRNPFFINQFLITLHEKGLICFNSRRRYWDWDQEKIAASPFTENVAEMLSEKLESLPPACRQTLHLASCLGTDFDLSTLSLITGQPPGDVHLLLMTTLQASLVAPTSEVVTSGSDLFDSTLIYNNYKFSHDRVRQAAYSLPGQELIAQTHLRIGRMLLSLLSPRDRGNRILELVDHLNVGKELITDVQERINLVELNLLAARKAKKSAAFAAARGYLNAGLESIPDDAWSASYQLALDLHLEQAESAYVNSDFEQLLRIVSIVSDQAENNLDLVKIYGVLADGYTNEGDLKQAVACGLKAAKMLGLVFPDEPKAISQLIRTKIDWIQSFLGAHPVEGLLDLPMLTDPTKLAQLSILSKTVIPAFIYDPELSLLLLTTLVETSLREGNSVYAPQVYCWYGYCVGSLLEEEQLGHQLAQVADNLADQLGVEKKYGITFLLAAIRFVIMPSRQSAVTLREVYRASLEYGDRIHQDHTMITISYFDFFSGKNLGESCFQAETFLSTIRQNKGSFGVGIMSFLIAVNHCFQGRTTGPTSFEGPGFNESRYLEATGGQGVSAVRYYFFKLWAAYLCGDYATAGQALAGMDKCASQLQVEPAKIDYPFYHSLTLTALSPTVCQTEQREFMVKLEQYRPKIKKWADLCPENHLCKHLMLEAELARMDGRDIEAANLYDQAVSSAEDNGLTHLQALANELAAKFWLGRKNAKVARVYLMEAHYHYQRWGAAGKVRQLEEQYPAVLAKRDAPDQPAARLTVYAPGSDQNNQSNFDLAAVVKASQAVSGEIVLADLLKNLMSIAMENAGADKGCLILAHDQKLVVEAQASLGQDTRLEPRTIENCPDLSASVVRYVARTGETILLDDPVSEGTFTQDPYIQRHQPHSVLCLPILRRGQLTGLLYLENRLATGAFTSSRVAVLELLATQAAISIQNAQLYGKLEVSEQKYRSLFENALEGIFQATSEGQIINANPALARMTGYDWSTPLPAPEIPLIRKFYVHPGDREELIRRLQAEGQVTDFETQMFRRDGSVFWASISARIVRPSNGPAFFYEGSMVDISARKEKEKAELERQAAEAANQAKTEFLAMMSHEIRTPINAIIGFTDLALRTDLNSRQSNYLSKTKRSALDLLHLINDILDFSKVEANKIEMERVEFRLTQVLENLSDMFRDQAAEKGLNLVISAANDTPEVLVGDPMRVGQVLTNLISNALKFTHHGGVVVNVIMERIPSEHARLKFCVRDSGIGISKPELPRLFDPFTQADDSITRKYGGTGLGLAICKRLVSLMEGEIWVESQPGLGSEFYFTADFGLPSQPLASNITLPKTLQGVKVLIAAKDQAVRESVQEMLLRFGCAPMTADSGSAVLQALSGDGPGVELLIVNVQLSGANGLSIIRRIRQTTCGACVPVILMSNSALEETSRVVQELGVKAVLLQPIKPSLLFDTIVGIFGRGTIKDVKGIKFELDKSSLSNKLHGARVLLVEDNLLNQELAMELLLGAGLKVDVANNGREAVSMINKDRYDAVLMDLQMPIMDGYEASRLIRQDPDNREIPIIAMTAHALQGISHRCLESGMNDYLSKPIEVERLFSVLSKWIQPQSGAAEPLPQPVPSDDKQDASFPETISGIDVASGLARLGGNRRLLINYWRGFYTSYSHATNEIRDALQQDDLESAKRLIHNLKGMAGNCAATELYAAAASLEQTLEHGNQNDLDRGLQQLEIIFDQVMDVLATIIPPEALTPTQSGVPMDLYPDSAVMTPLLIRLMGQLCENDLDAKKCFENIKEQLGQPLYRENIERLESQINRLDFHQARQTVIELAQLLDLSLEQLNCGPSVMD
ncbi:MAG: AAA family ATPase [Deltaproteobacteria bacterium]|nr:AAA family ATPase [Deltaproteobacteria bacterium]